MNGFLMRWTGQALLFPLLLIFCSALNAVAQVNYYVATTGSDSNPGTQAQPWATITHAASTLSLGSGGTVVHVAAGTYNECPLTGQTIAKSGTSDSVRVRFVSDSKYGAKVQCNQTNNGIGVWTNGTGANSSPMPGQYVDIVNFEITSSGTASCIGIRTLGAFSRIMGNYIHDIPAISATCTQGGAGVSIGFTGNAPPNNSHDTQVIGNIIDNVGFNQGVCVTMHGIYPATPDFVVQNNIVSRACGWGIHSYHDTPRGVISNNTVINNLRGGILVSASDLSASPNNYTVTNNIVVNNGGSENGVEERYGNTSGPNSIYYNHIVYNNQSNNFYFAFGSRPTTGSVSLTATQLNGLFVNYTGNAKTGDYHLPTGSLAIGAGTASCASGGITPCTPSTDIDGNPRPNPPSVGAYESASSGPAAPAGLMVTVQ